MNLPGFILLGNYYNGEMQELKSLLDYDIVNESKIDYFLEI